MKHLKKILSSALLLAVLSNTTVETSAMELSPLAQDTLDSMGIFVPDTMTRGDFSMIIMELSGNQHLSSLAQSPFSDVPSYREDASAIGVIYQLGLLSGNGDGTFAPDRPITVGETVTALLRLLDYSASEIGFRWPEDYVMKAQSLGLLDNLPTDSTATFTQDMTSQLLYNLICLETKTGEIYGEQRAASVVRDVVLLSNYGNNGGAVDQLSVVVNGVTAYYSKDYDFPTGLLASGRGTLLLDSAGKAIGFLPNDELYHQIELDSVSGLGLTNKEGTFFSVPSTATLMIGETKTTFGASYFSLETYHSALICYGNSGTVELIIAQNNVQYADFVLSGYYETATPNPYQPETVTTLGHTFDVDPDIAYKFSQFAYGDQFHLVLGELGEVTDVIAYSPDYVTPLIGILGNNSVITLLNGIEITGDTTSSMYAQVGQLVKVTPKGIGKINVAPARFTSFLPLNLDTMKFGKYSLAEDVKVFECVDHGPASAIALSDIYLHEVPAEEVRYYQLNDKNEVEILLLNNATGDQYTYGIIDNLIVKQNTSLGLITNQGATLHTVHGVTAETVTRVFLNHDGAVGGMIWADDGDLVSGIILTATEELSRLSLIDGTYMVSDGNRIPLAKDVAVYHTRLDRWITLAEAMVECEIFVGHYDKTIEEGGQIRVIYATDVVS